MEGTNGGKRHIRVRAANSEKESGWSDDYPVYFTKDVPRAPDRIYEYKVSACNGNGEGPCSPPRNTEPGGLADWDPRPFEKFRRDARSHEFGYDGFDHWTNAKKKVLTYPID